MPIRAFGALKERFVRDALLHGRTHWPDEQGRRIPTHPCPRCGLEVASRLKASGWRICACDSRSLHQGPVIGAPMTGCHGKAGRRISTHHPRPGPDRSGRCPNTGSPSHHWAAASEQACPCQGLDALTDFLRQARVPISRDRTRLAESGEASDLLGPAGPLTRAQTDALGI